MEVIKGKKPQPPIVLIYGVHGIGKSTLATTLGKPYFIDCEGGLDQIGPDRSARVTCAAELNIVVDQLATAKHDHTTVVIDTVSAVEVMFQRRVADAAGKDNYTDIGFGGGYAKVLAEWQTLMDKLKAIREHRNMAIAMIAHSQIERFEAPDSEGYDRYTPALYKSVSALLQQRSDAVLFACYKTYLRQEDAGFNQKKAKALGDGERILRTQERPFCQAKNRYGWPYEIAMTQPFNWNELFSPTQTQTKESAA